MQVVVRMVYSYILYYIVLLLCEIDREIIKKYLFREGVPCKRKKKVEKSGTMYELVQSSLNR